MQYIVKVTKGADGKCTGGSGMIEVNNVYVKKVKSVKVSSIQGVTLSSVRRPF